MKVNANRYSYIPPARPSNSDERKHPRQQDERAIDIKSQDRRLFYETVNKMKGRIDIRV